MRRLRRVLPLLLATAACTGAEPDPGETTDDGTEYEEYNPDSKADGATTRLGGPLHFSAECMDGDRMTIGAVGDLLMHAGLQKQAYKDELGFRSLWTEMEDLFWETDVMYANLEGPIAPGRSAYAGARRDPGKVFDNVVYTGYPRFNYHTSLADDLVSAGVNVVSTANNHSLDRDGIGADLTIDALEALDLPYTGTRRQDGSGDWHTYTESSGFRLAWVACTFSTNGIPDRKKQVLGCYTDTPALEALVRQLAAEPGVDAVIVTPHWGVEYVANPRKTEVNLAHRLLDAGATVVFGGHPHVLQPWEKHVTPDGRETFVIYSLGNFVSGQRDLPRRSTLLLYVGLVRGEDGVTRVEGVRYVPLHMTLTGTTYSLQAIDRVGGLTASRNLTTRMFGTENIHTPGDWLLICRQ